MKVTDLMVGDWVNVNGLNLKVGAIHADEIGVFDPDYKIYWCSDDGLDRIDPIPLTESILVKNGFRIQVTDDNSRWLWVTDNSWLAYSERHNYWHYEDMKITYVHQLQHLLRLVGVQKEIEL